MGVVLSAIQRVLNLLLPFTSQNTPLYQDLIHTVILCGTLYFAPQIADHYNTRFAPPPPSESDQQLEIPNDATPDTPIEDLPIDENFILQSDTDGEEEQPPPLAPTPPPNQAHIPPAEVAAWQPNEQAGPADDRPRPTHANRVIGAKKAKSLARRDQRRAYHEFHREQAEMRRREEAEGKEEREAELAAKKARRAEAEREIAEKDRLERERKKEEERREQEEERERRERAVTKVRGQVETSGGVDLVNVAWEEGKDRMWIERLVRASGMLAQLEKEGERVMITADGWLVRLDSELMQQAYADAVAYGNAKNGRVSFAEFGGILGKAVRARVSASA